MASTDPDSEVKVTVHRLIVHKVDHKNYDQPVLADLETEITDEVASFIRQHVRRNRDHKNASTARFGADAEDKEYTVRHLCDEILRDERLFVSNTRQIATLLFNAQRKKNSSAGELVVCLFYDDKTEDKWLALMKMDPEDGFIGREEKINDQIRIVLERVEGVLPTGALQKCAFILPTAHRVTKECDLIVLDQQNQNYGGSVQVASFFLYEFLNCERDLNGRELTRKFLHHVNHWASEKEGIWPPDRIDELKKAANSALHGLVIDVPDFAHQNLNDPQEEQAFVDTFREDLQALGNVSNLVFPPDAETRNYQTFRGDYGLQVRIRIDENAPRDFINVKREPGTQVTVVTIRTTSWTEG